MGGQAGAVGSFLGWQTVFMFCFRHQLWVLGRNPYLYVTKQDHQLPPFGHSVVALGCTSGCSQLIGVWF